MFSLYLREVCIPIWYLLPLILLKPLQLSVHVTKSGFHWPGSEHGGKDLGKHSIDTYLGISKKIILEYGNF